MPLYLISPYSQTQNLIDAAIANLTPEGIGAEPVGAVQQAIAALTAADIDAATLEDLEAAIAALTPGQIGAATQENIAQAIAIQNFAFPALQNSWEPGYFGSPQIQKQNKMVTLSGSLSNPKFLSQDSLIGVLPPECRPTSSTKLFASAVVAQNQSGQMIFPTEAFLLSPSGELFGAIFFDNSPLKILSASLDNCCYFVD